MRQPKATMAIFLGVVCALGSWGEPTRMALVIGNADYAAPATLKNPVNDAQDVSAALKKAGWQVTLVTNADRRVMTRAISTWGDELGLQAPASALFYYAGHGMQIDGTNYLLPVKTLFETVDDVKLDAVSLSSVTASIEGAGAQVSLIILDACRDNPYAKVGTRSLGGSRGLTVVASPAGVKDNAIMYSTSPGDVAQDGTGRNGVFTEALLRHLLTDAKIEDMFKRVTVDVSQATGGKQKPWINASMASDFFVLNDAQRAALASEKKRMADELAQRSEAAAIAKATEDLRRQLEEARMQVAAAQSQAPAATRSNNEATAALEAVSIADFEQPGRSILAFAGALSKARAEVQTELVHSGKNALKVSATSRDWSAAILPLSGSQGDWSRFSQLHFWLFGTNTGQSIHLDWEDREGENFRTSLANDFQGWKEITLPFSQFVRRTDWQPEGVKGNNKVDWPLRSFSPFSVDRFEGFVVFDDLMVQGAGSISAGSSTAPALAITGFETAQPTLLSFAGPKSTVAIELQVQTVHEGKRALLMSAQTNDWTGVVVSLSATSGDWSRLGRLHAWVVGTGRVLPYNLDLEDSGGELFRFKVAGAIQGWKELTVPLADFAVRTDYQPPTATRNGVVDWPLRNLQFITDPGFKGSLVIDDVWVEP